MEQKTEQTKEVKQLSQEEKQQKLQEAIQKLLPTPSVVMIDNKDIVKIIKKKGKLVHKGRDISKKIEKLNKELSQVAVEAQKESDKVSAWAKSEVYPTLEKYSDIVSVSEEKGKVKIEYRNKVEEAKVIFEQQAKIGDIQWKE